MKPNLSKRKTSIKNLLNVPIIYIINIFLIFDLIIQAYSLNKIYIKLISTRTEGKIINPSYINNNYYFKATIDRVAYDKSNFSNLINSSGQDIYLEWTKNFSCCNGLFSVGAGNIIKEINLNNFQNTAVTTTYNMFLNQTSLEKVTFGRFKSDKINDMRYMFKDCISLTTVDLSSLNFTQVSHMDYMFSNAKNITSLVFPRFKFSCFLY